MANYVEQLDIAATKFVIPSSRYANSTVEYYTENKILTFEIYKRGNFLPSPNDKYMVIPKGKEYRPDLLSSQYYGTTDFWWKIMEANGMKDILEFKAGVNIRLPANVFL